MSHNTRSKASSLKSSQDQDPIESNRDDDGPSDRLAFLESVYTAIKSSAMDPSSTDISALSFKPSKGTSIILDHDYGHLYPTPLSIKSPQISIYQSGLVSLASSVFHKDSDFIAWFDDFLAQALIFNMH